MFGKNVKIEINTNEGEIIEINKFVFCTPDTSPLELKKRALYLLKRDIEREIYSIQANPNEK